MEELGESKFGLRTPILAARIVDGSVKQDTLEAIEYLKDHPPTKGIRNALSDKFTELHPNDYKPIMGVEPELISSKDIKDVKESGIELVDSKMEKLKLKITTYRNFWED